MKLILNKLYLLIGNKYIPNKCEGSEYLTNKEIVNKKK